MFYNRGATTVNKTTELPPHLKIAGYNAPKIEVATYYQIFEGQLPLNGLAFDTIKEARQYLRTIPATLEYTSLGWFKVSPQRSIRVVRNTLGVVKVYGDGTEIKVTYVIKQVRFETVTVAPPSVPTAGRALYGGAAALTGKVKSNEDRGVL